MVSAVSNAKSVLTRYLLGYKRKTHRIWNGRRAPDRLPHSFSFVAQQLKSYRGVKIQVFTFTLHLLGSGVCTVGFWSNKRWLELVCGLPSNCAEPPSSHRFLFSPGCIVIVVSDASWGMGVSKPLHTPHREPVVIAAGGPTSAGRGGVSGRLSPSSRRFLFSPGYKMDVARHGAYRYVGAWEQATPSCTPQRASAQWRWTWVEPHPQRKGRRATLWTGLGAGAKPS